MKIRITKKGLPKAQMWNSQIGKPMIDDQGLMWGATPGIVTQQESEAAFGKCGPGQVFSEIQQTCISEEQARQEQQAMAGFKDYLNRKNRGLPTNPFKTTGNEGTASNPMTPKLSLKTPDEEKKKSQQQGLKYNNPFSQSVFDSIDRALPWALGATELINSGKRKREFDSFMRRRTGADSLFPQVPTWMSGNRGDYVASGTRFGEFRPNEYVVNKGMYTSPFYPTMQFGGGVIPDALSVPLESMEANISTAPVMPAASESSNASSAPARSSGANEEAEQAWEDISTEFQGVKHLGIWGDKRHQKTKSDHNSGDALDIGIQNADQGTQIAQKLIKEAQERNIKYIIWNRKIWNPSVSNEWRDYNGENPHTSHVHVSFNRNPESTGQISLTHNNPLNIHHGDFASKYGGKQGAKDAGGYVSMFPDFDTGIRAAKDLLFGGNYANLTVSQARNKWVTGDPNKSTNSTSHIVSAMGGDKVLADLTPAEREALIKQFSKWEGKQAYNKLKNMKLYAEGGSVAYNQGDVYELTEDEIKSILAAGGEVEFL